MLFYRYQNTKDIELNSYYVDLIMLKEDFIEYKNVYKDNLDEVILPI